MQRTRDTFRAKTGNVTPRGEGRDLVHLEACLQRSSLELRAFSREVRFGEAIFRGVKCGDARSPTTLLTNACVLIHRIPRRHCVTGPRRPRQPARTSHTILARRQHLGFFVCLVTSTRSSALRPGLLLQHIQSEGMCRRSLTLHGSARTTTGPDALSRPRPSALGEDGRHAHRLSGWLLTQRAACV